MMEKTNINIKLATINVNGIARYNMHKRRMIIRMIKEHNIGICALQEIKAENFGILIEDYDVHSSRGQNKAWGVALIIKKNIFDDVPEVEEIIKGNVIACRGKIKDRIYEVISLYIPTEKFKVIERVRILDELQIYLKKTSNKKPVLIVMGDYNRMKGTVKELYEEFLEQNNLVDTWKIKYPNKPGFTWRNKSRIDKILISIDKIDMIQNLQIKKIDFTDHSLLMMMMGRKEKKMETMWKMKNGILDIEGVEEDMIHIINKSILNQDKITGKWNQFKAKLISLFKDKEYIMKRNNIIKKDEMYEQNIKNIMKEAYNMENIPMNEEYEIKYITEYDYRIKTTAYIETKEKWNLYKNASHEDGDEILQIEENDKIIDDKEMIKEKFQIYYKNIYNNEIKDVEIKMSLYKQMELIDDTDVDISKEITNQEIEFAIKNLQKNKSPGKDGLRAEMYLKYMSILTPILKKLFNEIKNTNNMPEGFKDGYIRLIPKKKKAMKIEDFRPLTLLNIDFKLYTKILGIRLMQIIENRINNNQTYAMKRRNMIDNLKIITQAIWEINKKKLSRVLVSLDIQKAFDSVRYEHLYLSMRFLGITKKSAIILMNTVVNGQSQIKLNGQLNKIFELTNGLRQGDPLSAALFVIVLEPILRKIGKELRQQSFKINNTDVTTITYADDIVCFVKDNEGIKKVIDIFKNYENQTGLKLNLTKTCCLKFNSSEFENKILVGNDEIKELNRIKILGIVFGKKGVNKTNYEEIIEEIKNQKGWYKRRKYLLTYDDKIELINARIISRVLFLANVYKFSMLEIKQIQRHIDDIFWDFRRHWVKRSIVYAEKKYGGYKLPNIRLKIAAQRIKRLLEIILREDSNSRLRIDRGYFGLNDNIERNFLTIYQSSFFWKKRNLPPILNQLHKYEKMLKINIDFKGGINQMLKMPLRNNYVLEKICKEIPRISDPNIYFIGEYIEKEYKERYKRNIQIMIIEKLVESMGKSTQGIHEWRKYDCIQQIKKITLIKNGQPSIIKIIDVDAAQIYTHLLEHYIPGNPKWNNEDNEIYGRKYPKKIVDYTWRFLNGAYLTPKLDVKINKKEYWNCPICNERTYDEYHILIKCLGLGNFERDIQNLTREVERKILAFFRYKREEIVREYIKKKIEMLNINRLVRMMLTYTRYRYYGKILKQKEVDCKTVLKFCMYLLRVYTNIFQDKAVVEWKGMEKKKQNKVEN